MRTAAANTLIGATLVAALAGCGPGRAGAFAGRYRGTLAGTGSHNRLVGPGQAEVSGAQGDADMEIHLLAPRLFWTLECTVRARRTSDLRADVTPGQHCPLWESTRLEITGGAVTVDEYFHLSFALEGSSVDAAGTTEPTGFQFEGDD